MSSKPLINTTTRMRDFWGSGQNLLLGAQGNDTYMVHTQDALARVDAQTGEVRFGTQIGDRQGRKKVRLDAAQGDVRVVRTAQGRTSRRMLHNTSKYIASYSIPMPRYCRNGLQTESSNDAKWGVAA